MIYYVEDLRHTKCVNPKCTECSNEFYLHGRCHIEASSNLEVDLNKNIIIVKCSECHDVITNIAIQNDLLRCLLQVLSKKCHEGVWVCYKHLDEKIHISCAECGKKLGSYVVDSGVERL